jgi:hypothetical protein
MEGGREKACVGVFVWSERENSKKKLGRYFKKYQTFLVSHLNADMKLKAFFCERRIGAMSGSYRCTSTASGICLSFGKETPAPEKVIILKLEGTQTEFTSLSELQFSIQF